MRDSQFTLGRHEGLVKSTTASLLPVSLLCTSSYAFHNTLLAESVRTQIFTGSHTYDIYSPWKDEICSIGRCARCATHIRVVGMHTFPLVQLSPSTHNTHFYRFSYVLSMASSNRILQDTRESLHFLGNVITRVCILAGSILLMLSRWLFAI